MLAVGFDDPGALAAVADRIGWSAAFLADPDRRLYRRLGLRRAPWWRVWSPRTLGWYARLGRGVAEPVDEGPPTDLRQMGGDAIVVAGVVTRLWRPRTPVDRVDAVVLVDAARG